MMSAGNDFYHAIAKDYATYGDDAVTDWFLGFFNVYKYLSSPSGDIKGKTVLDYGCGTGKFCRFLKDKGARVIGVDVSSDMLQIAKTISTDDIAYHHIQSGCLDFIPSNSIEYVTVNFVLCILNLESEMLKILKELQRVLKADGKLVMLNVNWEQAQNREFISFKPEPVKELSPGQHLHITLKGKNPIQVEEHFWPITSYCCLFKQAGLSIEMVDQPKASEDDKGHPWLDECNYAPFSIIVGKKG
ncbi:TPA: hypothetical protein DIC20_00215 [Candidatus Dependentiae bacterium]|nr:hypothetical protein [Candidatus Dependentiae bacterium]